MREKDKTISDIARAIWGTTEEVRGENVYEDPKNRQTISRYLSGKAYPSENTKQRLADVLGVSYAELFPKDDPTNRPGSGVTLTQVSRRDSLLDLHIILPTEKAMQIIREVQEYAR